MKRQTDTVALIEASGRIVPSWLEPTHMPVKKAPSMEMKPKSPAAAPALSGNGASDRPGRREN